MLAQNTTTTQATIPMASVPRPQLRARREAFRAPSCCCFFHRELTRSALTRATIPVGQKQKMVTRTENRRYVRGGFWSCAG